VVAAIVVFLLELVEPGLCIRILPAVVILVGATIVLSVGLCCELVVRTRYLTSGHRPYRIARSVNFNQT